MSEEKVRLKVFKTCDSEPLEVTKYRVDLEGPVEANCDDIPKKDLAEIVQRVDSALKALNDRLNLSRKITT